MDPFLAKQDPTTKMNYAATQEHVTWDELNNRIIKELVWVAYHRLSFTNLLCILVKHLVMKSTKELNLFPNKHGVLKYLIPLVITHKESLD